MHNPNIIHRLRQATIVVFALIFMGFTGVSGASQLALVDEDVGHAFLFNYRGNCFALLPSHVARHNRFSLDSPPPRIQGSGEVFARDIRRDLAIAYVDGALARRCTGTWQQLPRNLTSKLESSSRGEITRVGPEGVVDRTSAIIIEYDRDEIFVKTTDDWARGDIQQGTSGSILSIDGVVAGIAQKSRNERQARFFRMDEIVRLLAPVLAGDSVKAHPTNKPIPQKSDGSLGFRISSWRGQGQSAETAATNLERGILGQAYATEWKNQPVILEITLSDSQPKPLSLISLVTDMRFSQTHTPPKTVLVEVDSASPPNAHWRSLGSRDMTPTGKLDFPTGGIFARRIRLTVQSVWFSGRALRLDGLRLQ